MTRQEIKDLAEAVFQDAVLWYVDVPDETQTEMREKIEEVLTLKIPLTG